MLLTDLCTQMLCECTALQQPDKAALWGELLQALLAFLDGQAAPGTASAPETDVDEADEGEVRQHTPTGCDK